MTGVKLIINRVKLIKGLCARWGAGRALPLLSGSGELPALGAPGAPGPSRKEKGGGEWGGGGRRRWRRLQQKQQQLRWWLPASESGGSSRRRLAPGWLGSAHLGVRVRVQSRSPGAARGRCSAPQRQPPPPFSAPPPSLPSSGRDHSLPRKEWGTAGDAAGPAHASAAAPPRWERVKRWRGPGDGKRGEGDAERRETTAHLGSAREPERAAVSSSSSCSLPPSQPRGARPDRIAALIPQQRSADLPVLSAAPSNPSDPDNAAASPPFPPRNALGPRAASSSPPPPASSPGAARPPRRCPLSAAPPGPCGGAPSPGLVPSGRGGAAIPPGRPGVIVCLRGASPPSKYQLKPKQTPRAGLSWTRRSEPPQPQRCYSWAGNSPGSALTIACQRPLLSPPGGPALPLCIYFGSVCADGSGAVPPARFPRHTGCGGSRPRSA